MTWRWRLSTSQQSQGRSNIGVMKKNYIINGAMMVSQENGVNFNAIHGWYGADQFFSNFGGTSAVVNFRSYLNTTPAGSLFPVMAVLATKADATADAGDCYSVLSS